MKKISKKFFGTVLSTIICLSMFYSPAYAAEMMDTFANTESSKLSDAIAPHSDMILSEAAILDGTVDQFTFQVPENGTYTVTMSVRSISGSTGIWTFLQGPTGNVIIDRDIWGTYQERHNLQRGTHVLRLTTSGKYAYSITINRTF